MRFSLLVFSFCIGGAFSVCSFAEEDCSSTQMAMNECAANGYKIEDDKLNKLYKLQMSYLKDPVKKEQLKKAQLAWIKYRDAACEYEVTSNGGSMYPMAVNSCLSGKTHQRNIELEQYTECRENGCPD